MSSIIDISIVVISFNQENFITRCIESIINQNFDGSIELLIGDDKSQDSTVTKIKQTITAAPFKIHFEERIKNIGPSANLVDLILKANGKYICILEGDDFWNSAEKLELQYSFLEMNNQFSACTHKYSIIDEDDNVLHENYVGKGAPTMEVYTIKDFENYIYPGHLGTLMFRNSLSRQSLESIRQLDRYIADIAIVGFLVFQKPIFILDKNFTSVRLIKVKGGSNYKSQIKAKSQNSKRIRYINRLKKMIEEEYGFAIKFRKRAFSYFFWSLLFVLRHPSRHNLIDLYHCTQNLFTGKIINWKYEI